MASELGVQTIQHTNGTDALTVGSDGAVAIDRIQIPSFMVTAANLDQSYTATDSEVVQFGSSADLDTESAWDTTNHRYTPSIAGWYSFSGCVRIITNQAHAYIAIEIVKNGTDFASTDALMAQYQIQDGSLYNGSYPVPTGLIYLNGTTDYVNLCFRSGHNCTLSDNATIPSWFCGQLVKAGS